MREDIKEILFTQEDLKAITKELGEKSYTGLQG